MNRTFLWFPLLGLAATLCLPNPPVMQGRPGWAGFPTDSVQAEVTRGVDVLRYAFHIAVNDTTDEIRGIAEIEVLFRADTTDGVRLDLIGGEGQDGAGTPVTGMTVKSVTENGTAAPFQHAENKLWIPVPPGTGPGETRTYTVEYTGVAGDGLIIDENKFGDRTFFGDNWPERARHWLPTVDHPADKAFVDWYVTAPDHYRVVANGRFESREERGDGGAVTHWRSVAPIPTKVMVMGVARFAVDTTAVVEGIPVEAWVFPQNREAGFRDFALAEGAVRFLQEKLGPFPYAKLANVQSRTRYGGMENASAIFYNERAVRGDGGAETLIVHEVAHQWFGDSVTEREWPHLWLSEGFATYMTHAYIEEVYGNGALVAGLDRDRRTVIRFHQERSNLPLIPTSLMDPQEMLNPNAYQKGSWVLHMLRSTMGDDAFWMGMREFYRTFRDSTALTSDFRDVMERVSGLDLSGFFSQWTERPGHPVLRASWELREAAAEIRVTLQQVQDGDPFHFPLELATYDPRGGLVPLGTVQISGSQETFSLPTPPSTPEPKGIVLDPGTRLLFQEVSGAPEST